MDIFYNKLKIPKQEFLFQFQSHQNYPSALSFSDTLTFLGLKNEVFEVEKEDWYQLPNKFITVYNNKFTLIEKIENDFFIYNDKKEKISKENLYQYSENIVFIFEESEEISLEKKVNFKWVFFSILFLTLIYSCLNHTLYLFLFNILSSIGLSFSLELFNNKFGNKSTIINKICSNSSEENYTKNNCNKIFNSDKIDILGLKLSDFSLIYFLSLSIIGVFIDETNFFLKCLSYSSISIILYSLYIQTFKEKTFCKICIIIISTLIGQITISALYLNNNFNVNSFLISSIVFSILFFLVLYFNQTLSEKEKYYISSMKNLKFKKNYNIFKQELTTKFYSFNTKNDEFLLGKKDSKLNISIITNPYCGYCREAYKIVKKIINKYPVSVQLRFNYTESNQDENLKLLISTFRNILKDNGETLLFESIEFWHANNNIDSFKKKYNEFIFETDMEGIEKLGDENINFGLTQTPQILINNYLFPHLYDREDIFFFIDELLEDDDIIYN